MNPKEHDEHMEVWQKTNEEKYKEEKQALDDEINEHLRFIGYKRWGYLQQAKRYKYIQHALQIIIVVGATMMPSRKLCRDAG